MSFYDRLRKAQRDTGKPILFEEALTEAFKRLGFSSKHIGGRDQPDIFLQILDRKIIIDAKTATEPIGEARVNFDALERYKRSYGADHVAVVAIGFMKGVVRETAKERHVILIETDAICKALENHTNYPYNPQYIYEILFGRNKTLVRPKDIDSSTKNMSKQIEMIKKVLFDLERLQKSGKAFNLDKAIVAYQWENPNITKNELEGALTFLSSPPFNIVKKEGDVYVLTLDYDEIRKSVSILRESLPKEERGVLELEKKKGRKGRGIVIQGEFIPCQLSKEILIETVEWLIAREKLKVPIRAGYKRYLINREPKHIFGEPFRAPKKLSNGWWLETSLNTESCIRYARRLLKESGLSEEDLDIRGFEKR